ncbi:MAG: bifunctional nicotinamidase/pyrazinamidase [Bryobacterales bacterium]|nr:bifunctional nicotinamidase/pyrazinamidase [Bryobacterales bacterium]
MSHTTHALILVDIQNDFLPGGALAVQGGDEVIAPANAAVARAVADGSLIVATQDWHPLVHGSFAANHEGKQPGDMIELSGLPQVLWPVHCVQNTGGALFAPGLQTRPIHRVVRKGTDPALDSYSGFFDNGHERSTELEFYLRSHGIERITVLGLATDYCVKYTALDGRELDFAVELLLPACRAVNLQPGDEAAAIAELRAAGVVIRE